MNEVATIERESEITEIATDLALTEPMGVSLARAEIDSQIATARKYPRSITRASKNIRDLVTLDKDAAAECMYALPRDGKPIQGPSIRLAEIIIQCWCNARCDARVIGVDRIEKVVIAEGIYHDLETNVASRATVRRSIAGRNGQIFSADMITVTGNAACSIAKRNAILAGVPKTVWNRAYLDAREVVAGTIKTLAVSRDNAIAAFANFGVKPEQIFPAIGVAGLEEITLDHIPLLRGMFSAIKNGEATVEEVFNPRKAPSTHEKVANPLADMPDHDSETGEVQQAQTAPADTDDPVAGEVRGEEASSDAAEQTAVDGDEHTQADEPSARDRLLHDLRAGIMWGENVLKLLNALPADQSALLSSDDKKKLKDDWRRFTEQDAGREE